MVIKSMDRPTEWAERLIYGPPASQTAESLGSCAQDTQLRLETYNRCARHLDLRVRIVPVFRSRLSNPRWARQHSLGSLLPIRKIIGLQKASSSPSVWWEPTLGKECPCPLEGLLRSSIGSNLGLLLSSLPMQYP